MIEALQSTNHWQVGRLAIRWMGAAAVVVAAALFPPANASTAKADPCPAQPVEGQGCTVIVIQQPTFPDGKKPDNKFDVPAPLPDGHWHANDITPPPDSANRLATVVGEDVDIYNAKNEPDGAGQVVGILRVGTQVQPVGGCAPDSWCQVTLPNGTTTGWVWGHLQLP